jgi:hypothetical protein
MQVEKMFCSFHKNLQVYESHRYCQCKACVSAIDLTLKVITHYGEFTQYQVHSFNKLIGKDLIVAHRLLKNEINPHEYWLLTDNLTTDSRDLPAALQWNDDSFSTESGDIHVFYSQLTPLKEKVRIDDSVPNVLLKMTKMISLTREYDTDIITLFHATGDFNHRHRWSYGVKKVEEVNHFLPRVGMKCRCITENGESYIYSRNYQYSGSRIEFTESDEKNTHAVAYILEKLDHKRSRLTLDHYITKGLVNRIVFNLREKRRIEEHMKASLDNLVELVKHIETSWSND